MKKTTKSTQSPEAKVTADQRRSFLKGAAVTTVAVGGGALAANAVADQPQEEVVELKKGYQETDHVRDYYRLARF